MRKDNTLKLVFIFLFVVGILAFLSLSYRAYLLIVNSSFTDSTFNVLLIDDNAHLLHLDKLQRKAVVIKFPSQGKSFLNKTRLRNSIELGVPIDGMIVAKKKLSFGNLEQDLLGFRSMFKVYLNAYDFKLAGLNHYDLLRIYLVGESISRNDIVAEVVRGSDALSKNEQLSKIKDNFRDRKIFNEKITVEVVNATGIDGMGGMASSMLTTLGYNVLSLRTEEHKDSKIKSRIKNGSPAIARLEKLLDLKVEKGLEAAIADVVIILGSDIAKTLN
mgnify:FL=1